jgi:restriction endonuclease S subunit
VGTIGSVAFVTEKYRHLTGSCKIAIIRPQKSVNPYYLAAYLASKVGQDQIARRIRGAIQQGLILPDLKEFPVPAIDDQYVAELEELIRESQQQQEKAQDDYAEAEALLLAELGLDDLDLSHRSTYTRDFSQTWAAGRLDANYWGTEHITLVDYLKSRSHSSLADLADFANGATPRGADYLEKGIPFLRIQNIGKNQLKLDDVVYIDEETHSELLRRSQLQPGDVLITITGRIGTSAVVPRDMPIGNINQHIVRMRLCDKQTNPYYLAAFLNSQAGRLQTEREAYGTTREALPYYCLERIIVPEAPTDLQKRVEAKIQEAEESLQEAKRLLEEAKRRVEEMVVGE